MKFNELQIDLKNTASIKELLDKTFDILPSNIKFIDTTKFGLCAIVTVDKKKYKTFGKVLVENLQKIKAQTETVTVTLVERESIDAPEEYNPYLTFV